MDGTEVGKASEKRTYLSVKGLILWDGKFLAVHKQKHAHGLYELPGGTMEYGETIEETLVREIREELGMTVRPIRLLGTWNFLFPEYPEHYAGLIYLCGYDGTPEARLSGEHDRFAWLAPDHAGFAQLLAWYAEPMASFDWNALLPGRIRETHPVFPTPDIIRTAQFYGRLLGFRVVEHLQSAEPHLCLYRDGAELILTKASAQKVAPNRELYGYGYDAYFITDEPAALENEFRQKGVRIVRPVSTTDYQNQEFVAEDIDGRWIGFGIKKNA